MKTKTRHYLTLTTGDIVEVPIEIADDVVVHEQLDDNQLTLGWLERYTFGEDDDEPVPDDFYYGEDLGRVPWYFSRRRPFQELALSEDGTPRLEPLLMQILSQTIDEESEGRVAGPVKDQLLALRVEEVWREARLAGTVGEPFVVLLSLRDGQYKKLSVPPHDMRFPNQWWDKLDRNDIALWEPGRYLAERLRDIRDVDARWREIERIVHRACRVFNAIEKGDIYDSITVCYTAVGLETNSPHWHLDDWNREGPWYGTDEAVAHLHDQILTAR